MSVLSEVRLGMDDSKDDEQDETEEAAGGYTEEGQAGAVTGEVVVRHPCPVEGGEEGVEEGEVEGDVDAEAVVVMVLVWSA